MSRQKHKVGCLFCGIGGFANGLKRAGFNIAWANDNNRYACATFRKQFPKTNLFEKDVCDLSVASDKLAPVSIVTAGFPCQSFSQAGDKKGFDDPRGKLFFEIIRLINEWDEDLRPSLIVLENVPFLLTGGNGVWFDSIRRELREAGYWFRESNCWVANVKDFTGLPQDRERLFLVAASKRQYSKNPFTRPEVNDVKFQPLHTIVNRRKRGHPDDYLHSDSRYYHMIMDKQSSGSPSENLYHLRRSYVREKKGGLCPTLTANMGRGGHNVPFVRDRWGIRRLSVDEVAMLQGIDEQYFPDIPKSEKYRLVGNTVCVELARIVGVQCKKILLGRKNV